MPGHVTSLVHPGPGCRVIGSLRGWNFGRWRPSDRSLWRKIENEENTARPRRAQPRASGHHGPGRATGWGLSRWRLRTAGAADLPSQPPGLPPCLSRLPSRLPPLLPRLPPGLECRLLGPARRLVLRGPGLLGRLALCRCRGLRPGCLCRWLPVWHCAAGSEHREVPQVYIEQEPAPVAPASQSAPAASYWYYCTQPAGYFPYVKDCSRPWMKVVPQAPGEQATPPQLVR